MPRGGKREGAGRKALPYRIKLEIGFWCEDQWRRTMKAKAFERHRARPKGRKIAGLQADAWVAGRRVLALFVQAPKHLIDRALAPISKNIQALDRYRSEPVRKVKGARAAILKLAAQKFNVAPTSAGDYWKMARATEVRLKKLRDRRGAPK
jgi:hypothetical protein